MSDFWNDPVAWRDAMLPPLTLRAALSAAKMAGVPRIVFRGVTFEVGERKPGAQAPEAHEAPPRSLFKARLVPKQKVVL